LGRRSASSSARAQIGRLAAKTERVPTDTIVLLPDGHGCLLLRMKEPGDVACLQARSSFGRLRGRQRLHVKRSRNLRAANDRTMCERARRKKDIIAATRSPHQCSWSATDNSGAYLCPGETTRSPRDQSPQACRSHRRACCGAGACGARCARRPRLENGKPRGWPQGRSSSAAAFEVSNSRRARSTTCRWPSRGAQCSLARKRLIEPVTYPDVGPTGGPGGAGIGDTDGGAPGWWVGGRGDLALSLIDERKVDPRHRAGFEVKIPTAQESAIAAGRRTDSFYNHRQQAGGDFDLQPKGGKQTKSEKEGSRGKQE